jgi:hypothetical protein
MDPATKEMLMKLSLSGSSVPNFTLQDGLLIYKKKSLGGLGSCSSPPAHRCTT